MLGTQRAVRRYQKGGVERQLLGSAASVNKTVTHSEG